MTLNETRQRFSVGSKVMVVRTGHEYPKYGEWAEKHLSPMDYYRWKLKEATLKKDDVGVILAVDRHGEFHARVIAAISVKGKGVYLIDTDSIVPAKTDRREEINQVEEKKPHRVKLDGTKLIVSAYGHTVTFNAESLIEDLEKDCKTLSEAIKVGDCVIITDPEECFDSYEEWASENMDFSQALRFQYGILPQAGVLGKVFAVAPHLLSEQMLYGVLVIDDFVEKTYIVGRDGLKRHEGSDPYEENK